MRTFRAATLNIWSRFGPWEERLVAIRRALEALGPEVIGLQEVHRFEGFDQAALIAEGLGYACAWGEASSNYGFPLGNAILSRWPIRETEVMALPDGGTDERRCALFAALEAPFGVVPVFCTHFNWRLEQGHVRCLQVKALVELIARRAPVSGFPPVILGDFNAEPDSDEIRFMRGLTGLGGPCVYFADAFAIAGPGGDGATFSHRNPYAKVMREPNRRIDYVFVRGPDEALRGEPLDARVCFDQPHEGGVFPSDHFGVVATITAGR